ncbi:MAG: hypothetical protein KKG84_04155, partial [Candidatus Omnitrophica bacterium]|nr:hypothetical protein [Candidatus Omnitrophota bacterium]
GTANMIDLEFPEILEWKKAKSILERGDIGTLRHIVVSWDIETYSNKKGLDSWKTRTDEGGGTLNQFASHVFYYLEWFVGPITSLSCRMHKAPGDTRRTDTLNIISAKTASGCALSVTISTHSIPGGGHRIEFYGSEGTMVLENTSSDHINGFKIFTAKRGTSKIEETCQHSLSAPDPDSRIAPVSCLVNRFLDWIETGLPQRPDLKDSLRVQQLLDAARRSNGSEQRIEVNK